MLADISNSYYLCIVKEARELQSSTGLSTHTTSKLIGKLINL